MSKSFRPALQWYSVEVLVPMRVKMPAENAQEAGQMFLAEFTQLIRADDSILPFASLGPPKLLSTTLLENEAPIKGV